VLYDAHVHVLYDAQLEAHLDVHRLDEPHVDAHLAAVDAVGGARLEADPSV
jgi:hypothetical protein